MQPLRKILSFFWFPLAVLLTHAVASIVLNLYALFPNMDIPFHFLGGVSIAYSAAQILEYLEKHRLLTNRLDWVIFLMLLFSITATATVFWEFAEFIADQALHRNIQVSLANTMQDQFMGILGGVTWISMWARNTLKNESRWMRTS